jgi:hypothetical protein
MELLPAVYEQVVPVRRAAPFDTEEAVEDPNDCRHLRKGVVR